MVKSQFSKTWKGSSQRRKQRKYSYNAPLHIKRKMLAVSLDKELRKKHGRRSIEVRKGDEVIIMKGKFKKKKGKVLSTDTNNSKVIVEDIQATKKDGTKVSVPIHASNLKIVTLNLDDKKRLKDRTKNKETKEKIAQGKVEVKVNKIKKGEKKNA